MRCLDSPCAFLDFFVCPRINNRPFRPWRRGLFYFVENVGASSARPWGFALMQNCTGGYGIRPYALHKIAASLLRRGALGGRNDARQPAKLARSCGSMPHWGIDRYATPQFHMLPCVLAPTPNCAGEQCSPLQSRLRFNNS